MAAKKTWHEGLTEKQRRFCEAYSANGGNALQAATSAGYRHPQAQSSKILENVVIRTALELLRKQTTSEAILTREQRQALWTKIALSEDAKMSDRLKATELLGRSQADFTDNHRHQGEAFNVSIQLTGETK
jgi:phage terminase small subunit